MSSDAGHNGKGIIEGDAPNRNAIRIGLPWLHFYGGPAKHWLCVAAMSYDGTPEWGDDHYPNARFKSGIDG